MFDGNNATTFGGRDLNKLEITAGRIIHDEFKINCEEQVILPTGAIADGFIHIPRKKGVVFEYDDPYYHGRTDDQKDRDSRRDSMLTRYGYRVVRISSDTILNDKFQFKTLILDALHNIKQRDTKALLPT